MTVGAEQGSDNVIRDDLGHGNNKSRDAFRTISEVAKQLDLPQHVLRFWETKFPQIRPMKRGGGRRYYRPEDIDVLAQIRSLLHDEGYTIKGVQKLLKKPGGLAAITPSSEPGGETGKAPDISAEAEVNSAGTDGISQNEAEQLLSELVAVRAGLKKFS